MRNTLIISSLTAALLAGAGVMCACAQASAVSEDRGVSAERGLMPAKLVVVGPDGTERASVVRMSRERSSPAILGFVLRLWRLVDELAFCAEQFGPGANTEEDTADYEECVLSAMSAFSQSTAVMTFRGHETVQHAAPLDVEAVPVTDGEPPQPVADSTTPWKQCWLIYKNDKKWCNSNMDDPNDLADCLADRKAARDECLKKAHAES